MRIAKGTRLKIGHKRKGWFYAIANSDFDTEDEWYDIVLDQDGLDGMVNDWGKGENIPARRGLCEVSVRE